MYFMIQARNAKSISTSGATKWFSQKHTTIVNYTFTTNKWHKKTKVNTMQHFVHTAKRLSRTQLTILILCIEITFCKLLCFIYGNILITFLNREKFSSAGKRWRAHPGSLQDRCWHWCLGAHSCIPLMSSHQNLCWERMHGMSADVRHKNKV